jgi:hypothetical protein
MFLPLLVFDEQAPCFYAVPAVPKGDVALFLGF